MKFHILIKLILYFNFHNFLKGAFCLMMPMAYMAYRHSLSGLTAISTFGSMSVIVILRSQGI